jgi:hypothetical protein
MEDARVSAEVRQALITIASVIVGGGLTIAGQVYFEIRRERRTRRVAVRVLFAEIAWYRTSVRQALRQHDPELLDPPDDLLAAWREHRTALAGLNLRAWMSVSKGTNAARLRELLTREIVDISTLHDADEWATDALTVLGDELGNLTGDEIVAILEPPTHG